MRRLTKILAAVLLLPFSLGMALPAFAATVPSGSSTTGTAGTAQTAAQESTVQTTLQSGVYDIILFWGQSNMVGWAKGTGLPYSAFLSDLDTLSEASGIDRDILEETKSVQRADIPLARGTVYQYNLLSDSLDPLTTGELPGITGKDEEGSYSGVTWDEETGTWQGCREAQGDKPAAQAAGCTNMIPAFCEEYVKETGHRVVVLFAAVGGVGIQAFLPMDHADYQDDSLSSVTNYSHMWEYIEASYQGAVSALKRQGVTIGSSLWVSYQGESDLDDTNYMKYYGEVKDELSDLGFGSGALVETSNTIGDNLYPYVERMHVWQEALALPGTGVTIGSTLDYDEYIPDSSTYAQYPALQAKWSGLDYATAYNKAAWYVDTLVNNRVHMNSAALSQIGRDTAENLIRFEKKNTTGSSTQQAVTVSSGTTAKASSATGTQAPVQSASDTGTGIQIIDYGDY